MLPKRWKVIDTEPELVAELQEALKIDTIFCELLVQRGVDSVAAAKRFFSPSLDELHDPFLMEDMQKAVDRLRKAIVKKQKILLYGDYDVDGTTSVALMYSFLAEQGAVLDYYIPDRYKEGYGISDESIRYAETEGIDLIIAMDCGIRAEKQALAAKNVGIDLIVCDHHLPGKQLPEAFAILDPKRSDCNYPFEELSGCGVAFKLTQAYVQQFDLPAAQWESLLDFLVISIAADIVPMVGENRVLAHFGLQKLNRTERLGLKNLIDHSKRERPLSISDVVFGLAPMINAAGRMADAQKSVQLMLATTKVVAADYTRVLDYRNDLRRDFERRITAEANELFSQTENIESRRSVVLYQEHWHKGVVGIVASRMVETYYRPTIILAKSGELVVGSARSVSGFDIHQAIGMCSDLLINFGGHKYAAGMTLRPENVQAFMDRFEGVVQITITEEQTQAEIDISSTLRFDEVTPKFKRILSRFAPFGPGNRNPIFQSIGVKDTGYSKVLKKEHLSLALQQENGDPFKGIAFGRADVAESVYTREPFDICYTLQENRWKGRVSLQLMVKDLRFK